MPQPQRAQALSQDGSGRYQQDRRDGPGQERRQRQQGVEQQDRAEESRGGGEKQESPQRSQGKAGLQQGLCLHHTDDQIEGQRGLAGGESQNSAAQQQNRRCQKNRRSIGQGAAQNRGQESPGEFPAIGDEGLEEGGICLNEQIDEGHLDGNEREGQIGQHAEQGEQEGVDGLDKEHPGHPGHVVDHPAPPPAGCEAGP